MKNIEEKGKSKSIHGINMRILRSGNDRHEMVLLAIEVVALCK
jgi:hypothetical protein